MKTFTKLLLVFCIGLISFTTTAQTEETVVITETERIIDKYGNKIVDGFNNVIENVTPYAEEGFKMVVKLQIAKGIAYLLIPFLTIILFIISFKCRSKSNLDKYNPDTYQLLHSVTLVLGGILFIASIPVTYHGILYISVPEWYAIKEILNLI